MYSEPHIFFKQYDNIIKRIIEMTKEDRLNINERIKVVKLYTSLLDMSHGMKQKFYGVEVRCNGHSIRYNINDSYFSIERYKTVYSYQHMYWERIGLNSHKNSLSDLYSVIKYIKENVYR